jgi:hypothetical protein
MNNPSEFIESYLSDLLDWEQKFYSLLCTDEHRNNLDGRADSNKQSARMKLAERARTFLTAKAYETHGETAVASIVVSNPPQYEQKIESVDVGKSSATVVCTPGNDGLLARYLRYTLTIEDGQWRIIQVHVSDDGIAWRKKAGL